MPQIADKRFLMRRAWQLHRGAQVEVQDFAAALRRAWREAKGAQQTRSITDISAALVTRIRSMREGRMSGLTRENWKELGALRDKLCSEISASV